jgi:hypothetical protein
MNDEELLDYVEAKTIEEMLDGCDICDHLGDKVYDTGAWLVSFRAENICRLIDMARKSKRTWVGLTNEEITQVIKSMPRGIKGWMSDWDLYEFSKAYEAKLKEKNT